MTQIEYNAMTSFWSSSINFGGGILSPLPQTSIQYAREGVAAQILGPCSTNSTLSAIQ